MAALLPRPVTIALALIGCSRVAVAIPMASDNGPCDDALPSLAWSLLASSRVASPPDDLSIECFTRIFDDARFSPLSAAPDECIMYT